LIGDRLETLALRGGREAVWIGLDHTRGMAGRSNHRALNSATASQASHCSWPTSALSPEKSVTRAWHARAWLHCGVKVDRGWSSITAIGGFCSSGGVIWSLTHLGVLWDEPLLAEAEFLVELLSALIERDEHFDLIAGAAGYISRLLCLHHCAPSGAVQAAARQCGDRLIAAARPMSRGIGWVTGPDSPLPLGSFSHGAAGTAWALLESARPDWREAIP